MNVYEKLQSARAKLQAKDLKKTGENKFSDYKYFELGDFMPHVNTIFDEVKLCGVVNFPNKESAVLTIFNTEKPDEQIIYNSSVAEVTLKGAHAVQNLGAVQTYLRRYLYINALEISESDVLDNGENEKEEDVSTLKIDKHKLTAIKGMIEKTNADTSMFCSYYGIEKLEDLTNAQFVTGMKALEAKESKQKKPEKKETDLKF